MGNKILIADDSKLIISLVKNIFQSQGEDFIVLTAYDGKEAVEKAEKEMPDIILMDWQMPEMSGLEALKILKASSKTKDIPVIMLTASESTEAAFDGGATDFVQKPFNKSELLTRVRTSLELVNLSSELKQKSIDLEIQRNKLKLQKDFLVKQKKEITSGNELTLKLGKLVVPPQHVINQAIKDNFFLYQPLESVPSCFLWIGKNGSKLYLCIGLFERHLNQPILLASGIKSILNEIVYFGSEENDLIPSQIYHNLKDRLNEISCFSDLKTSCFDIIICSFDPQNKILQYSGLNIPILVMKNDKLVELKTDRSDKEDNDFKINNHKVHLAAGDIFYILNNGFGENQTAIMNAGHITNELQEVIKKIYKKDLAKQKVLFEKTYENWKKDLRQLTDIIVFGIKV
jgi:CheY-like chemotaxis protein